MPIHSNQKQKYRQIASDLRKRILRGRMLQNSVLPSAKDITREYGCSMTTANAALDLLETDGIITRVKGSGNFVNIGPKEKHILKIGLADYPPDADDPLRKALVDIFPITAFSYLRTHGCTCRFIPYFILMNHDSAFLSDLDGLLLSSSFISDITEPFIRNLKFPVVIYKSEFEFELPFNQVIPDWTPSMRELFRKAIASGIQRVIIFHADHLNGRARMEALKKAAVLEGFPAKQISAAVVSSKFHEFFAMPAECKIKNSLVISCSALDVERIVADIGQRGYVCRKDYQLACVDDLSKHFLKDQTIPAVTCLEYSRESAARAAAKRLISAVRNPNRQSYQVIRFQTRLILRESAFQQQ